MQFLVAAVVVSPVVALVVGAWRGRVQVRSCCAVPAHLDGRMAAAFADDAITATPTHETS